MIKKIDSILDHFGGKRLSLEINTLGCLSVKTTVAGIHALTELEGVKAILEDQPISVIQKPER